MLFRSLERDLEDLKQQVGPVVGLVEEARSNAQHGRNMSRQRQLMLQSLVQRVHAVRDNLRIEVFAAGGSDDEAAYTFFFEQFLGGLEETAKDFDERVVEESRDLLVLATSRVFSNLLRLWPSFDLEAVMAPVDIRGKAREAAEVLARKYDQVLVDIDEGDGEEDALEAEAAVDGAGTSGGATA